MTESDAPEIYDAESENGVFINNNHIDETLMSNIQDIKGKYSKSLLFPSNNIWFNKTDMLEHCGLLSRQHSDAKEVREYLENLE